MNWFTPVIPQAVKSRLWHKKHIVSADMPQNLTSISLARFFQMILNYEISGVSKKGYTAGPHYLRGILIYFDEERTGVLIQQNIIAGKGIGIKLYQVDKCRHEYRPWDLFKDDPPGPGRCFSVSVCKHCGRRNEIDSSD